MKFTMEFECDNAAFEDNPDEVAHCVERTLAAILNGRNFGVVYDTFGNRVGQWRLA